MTDTVAGSVAEQQRRAGGSSASVDDARRFLALCRDAPALLRVLGVIWDEHDATYDGEPMNWHLAKALAEAGKLLRRHRMGGAS